MFDQLKQLNKIRELQSKLKQEKVTVEKDGVSITINGQFDLLEVKLNSELSTEKQEKLIKDCYSDAKDKIQKNLASSMAGQF
jgi:DNA-binding protein YbaB